MSNLLDGKVVSEHKLIEIAKKVENLRAEGLRKPHLAAILVGEDPASQTYVNSKVRTCEEIGFDSTLIRYPETVTESELLEKIKEINANDGVDGLIVQLSLPKHIEENKVIETIDPAKDVDGFHPVNVGKMVLEQETFISATPYGIMMLLDHYNIQTSGMHCVVVGRSNIVGTPMSILLSRNNQPGNCTVTLTHSRTKDLNEICASADLLIAAIGKPFFVKENMVKEGAIVVDVGINRIEDKSKKSGSRLVGDVDFEAVKNKVKYITPVPGGVGKMTICALMQNTLQAFEQKFKK